MTTLSLIFSNTIVAFIILISIIIFVHELGHFIAGRIFKIQVEEFSIGFGPVAYSFKKGPTVYRINWLPLGGYVRFYGADIEENIPIQNQNLSLKHAKVYKRALIAFAGPFANFALSFFIMGGLVWYGIPAQPTVISVIPNSVAEKSGLRSGDKIISINNENMENWSDLAKKIRDSANKKLAFVVQRDEKNISLSIVPANISSETIYGTREKSGKIGITPFFSQGNIVPTYGDFFSIIGITSKDKIISINGQQINYYYEIFPSLEKATGANSDFTIAEKIRSGQLKKNNLVIDTEGRTIIVDFNSTSLKKWAKENRKKDLWVKITPSSDLTLKEFAKKDVNLKSVEAWQNCGFKPGFTIKSINELKNITDITQVYSFFESIERNATAKNIAMQVNDDKGHVLDLTCLIPPTKKMDSLNREQNIIEFPFIFQTSQVAMKSVYITANSFFDGVEKSFHYLLGQMTLIYKGLKMLFSGSIPLSNLGGPIAVASIAGDAAKAGFMTFFLTMSLISVNIGMVNLLPLPALDGGTLLLLLVESFYGKPLPEPVQVGVQRAGIFVILFLFILVFYNDILRLFHT